MYTTNRLCSRAALSCAHHGFAKHRSCFTELLLTRKKERVTKLINEGDDVDLVFFQLCAYNSAFNSVSYRMLLYQLYGYGLHSNAIGWIHSFLSNHKFVGKIDNVGSSPGDACSGIPPGVSD